MTMQAARIACLMIAALAFGAGPARAQATGAAAPAAAPPAAAAAPAAAAPAAAAPTAAAAPAGAPAAAAPATAVGAKTAGAAPPPDAAADIHAPFVQSFFFTAEDIIAIHKALENQRTPQAAGGGTAVASVIPPVRRIALSGVVYRAVNDWLIWINGQKVTPTVSLKEIVDIKVERERVHLKWFDIGLNGVIDITMRPNETYDIGTGVLLPGIMPAPPPPPPPPPAAPGGAK